MTKKIKSPHRLKQDGTDNTMCLACFETISPARADANGTLPSIEEHDHVCAFAFPDRRANEITFEDGPKRRQSDMEWQVLVGREVISPGE